jgi:hypothetical protein
MLAGFLFGLPMTLQGEAVEVLYTEGLVHGFLTLASSAGSRLASGELLQVPSAGQVTSELVFHFLDGSLHDETVVFSQRGRFRLVRYHLVQHGPAFKRSIDMTVDAASGRVTVQSTDEHGRDERFDERLDLPDDVANGLVPVLLKNVGRAGPPKSLSLVVATPKPRLVKLAITSAESDLAVGGARRTATQFVLKVEIGGVAGFVAPLVGKQPPDSHVWILGGRAPAFVRAEQPFFEGGPVWRIDLATPPIPTGGRGAS